MHHTYRFTHDGVEYTRTTARTYTHAVVLYINRRYIVGGHGAMERCDPYVERVAYSGSKVGALRAVKPYHFSYNVIALSQPA